MQCLLKYKWVKLPRNMIPDMKGIMGAYMRLTARAAICNGKVRYCQYENEVSAGMWAGGIVGLKSILGVKNAGKALLTLKVLSDLDLISYNYTPENKYLWYKITDYISTGGLATEKENSVYVRDGSCFIRIPRGLTNRLIGRGYVFEEADAWLDLWSHTVSGDTDNVFSCMCPCVQFRRQEAALTLGLLEDRRRWNKLKVQRFIAKNRDMFLLRKLPGSYGCLIFNLNYELHGIRPVPTVEQIFTICRYIKRKNRNNRRSMTDRCQFCKLVLMYTMKCISFFDAEKRVSFPLLCGYSSLCEWHQYIFDCKRIILSG